MVRYALVGLLAAGLVSSPAWAGQAAESAAGLADLKREVADLRRQMEEQRRQYESQIEDLRRQVKDLAQRGAPAPAAPSPKEELAAAIEEARREAAAKEPQPLSLSFGRAIQNFNPDISVIGDVLGHWVSGERGERLPGGEHANEDRFQFRELELAFSAPVDPYARADFFVHIHEHDGEWHAGLCEGYLTLLTLPHNLQARIGKFRSAFGKANQLHTHNMPWVDRPNVITNFFGEEGMSEEGVEVSWLVPNPWDKHVQWTLNVQNNENAGAFAGRDADDIMFVNRLASFHPLSESSTLEIGVSHATAPNDSGHGGCRTHVEGLDLTYKWRPPREGLYKSLAWENEVLFSQKDQPDGAAENAWGLYSSLTYQFARRWSVFGRYDYSQFPDDRDSSEHAVSAGLTFAQSEYAFWRLSYKHTDTSGPLAGADRDEVWLQLNVGIGPHRAHKY
jgi:hypothetical protein